MKKVKKKKSLKGVTRAWVGPFLDELTLVPGVEILLQNGKKLIQWQQRGFKSANKSIKSTNSKHAS